MDSNCLVWLIHIFFFQPSNPCGTLSVVVVCFPFNSRNQVFQASHVQWLEEANNLLTLACQIILLSI